MEQLIFCINENAKFGLFDTFLATRIGSSRNNDNLENHNNK